MLGVVWRDGPCTAYAVRRELAGSSTPRWSASAGSIYPVLQRLEAVGLVAATARSWGVRGKREFAATTAGRDRLRSWVPEVGAPEAGGPAYDPIRTRVCFLAALTAVERRRFLSDAERSTRASLAQLRRELRQAGARIQADDFEGLSRLGSIGELEARLRWLGQVRRMLSG